jgi:hypothetical protein
VYFHATRFKGLREWASGNRGQHIPSPLAKPHRRLKQTTLTAAYLAKLINQ